MLWPNPMLFPACSSTHFWHHSQPAHVSSILGLLGKPNGTQMVEGQVGLSEAQFLV